MIRGTVSIGKKCRANRLLLGYSQSDVVKLSNISQPTISRTETGLNISPFVILWNIINGMEFTAEDFDILLREAGMKNGI